MNHNPSGQPNLAVRTPRACDQQCESAVEDDPETKRPYVDYPNSTAQLLPALAV